MQIGKLSLTNPLVLAPMAGITNLPFRLLAKQYEAGLVYSEMVSSHGLVHNSKRTQRYLLSHPAEKPLAVQLFGADAAILAEAAQIAASAGADLIDINLGCPVKKVVKTGAGCALMRQPRQLERILKKVRQAIGLPLTIKMRAGWDARQINALQIARIAQDCGVDAIALHGRTKAQGFANQADWQLIARVKQAVSCTVIGNGDVNTPADAKRMLEQTGADGVMVGRAARGNPWIFKQINRYLADGQLPPPPNLSERKTVIIRHFELLESYYDSTLALLHMRKHLIWYTQNLPQASAIRQQINTIQHKSQFLRALDDYWDWLLKLTS